MWVIQVYLNNVYCVGRIPLQLAVCWAFWSKLWFCIYWALEFLCDISVTLSIMAYEVDIGRFFTVPLKKSQDVDMVKPIETFVKNTYDKVSSSVTVCVWLTHHAIKITKQQIQSNTVFKHMHILSAQHDVDEIISCILALLFDTISIAIFMAWIDRQTAFLLATQVNHWTKAFGCVLIHF